MNKEGWRTLAIIFIVIFVMQTAFTVWGIVLVAEDQKNTNECYYDICQNYVEALYNEGVCTCYSIDAQGNYKIENTEVIE